MMLSNRMKLMWVLLIVLIGLLFLGAGAMGTTEVILWLALLVGWFVAVFTWARHSRT
jgi:hypothetical protein